MHTGRHRGIRGDVGRYREMQGDIGRCREISGVLRLRRGEALEQRGALGALVADARLVRVRVRVRARVRVRVRVWVWVRVWAWAWIWVRVWVWAWIWVRVRVRVGVTVRVAVGVRVREADARLPSLLGRERDAQRARRRGAERVARGVRGERAFERGRAALRGEPQPLEAARGAEEGGGRLVGSEQLGGQHERDRLALVDVVRGHGRQRDHHRRVVDAAHVLGLDRWLHRGVPAGGLGLHRLEGRGEQAAQRVRERVRLDLAWG